MVFDFRREQRRAVLRVQVFIYLTCAAYQVFKLVSGFLMALAADYAISLASKF